MQLWQLQTHSQSASLLLWWASGQTQFTAEATILEKELDLNPSDRDLLRQYGAVLQKHPIPVLVKSHGLYQANKTRNCENFCTVM